MDELIETSFLLPCSRGKAIEIRLNELDGYAEYKLRKVLKGDYIQVAREVHDPSLGCRLLLDTWWRERREPIALCPACEEFWVKYRERTKADSTLLVGAMGSAEWEEMLSGAFQGQPYKYFCGPEFHFKEKKSL